MERKVSIGKKGEMPFWLTMTIYILVGLVVVLGIIMLQKDKFMGFLDWLG